MFLILCALLFSADAFSFQYPEDRDYTSSDRGFAQYYTKSLYGSDRFSLTYDDGPHESFTPRILDVLKSKKAKATFFVNTDKINAATLPILVRAIKEGHMLASHGADHANSNTLDQKAFKVGLKKSILKLREVYKAAGKDFEAFYFRYPYGGYGRRADYHHMDAMQEVSQELFGDNCIQFAFWDIDTADWVGDMTSADIAQTLKAQHEGGRFYEFEEYVTQNGKKAFRKLARSTSRPLKGGVILQHDVHEKNIEATRLYLEYAGQMGLRIDLLPAIEEFEIRPSCRFLN